MTKLTKPVRRVANDELGGAYGSDKRRRLVVTIIPGNGGTVQDIIQLKPEGRRETAAKSALLVDIWSYLLRCEANKSKMEKLRAKLAKKREKEAARESRRIMFQS